MAAIVFGVAVGLVVYTYALYPLILYVLVMLKQMARDLRYILTGMEAAPPMSPAAPQVSLIIAAHNEEAVIENKLLNSLALDYPDGKWEILVASDGSTDRTNEIVAAHARHGVKLLDYADRPGKIEALNRAIAAASGEIIVLSDANVMYRPDAIRCLVKPFSDPKVGAVCGEVRLVGALENVRSEGAYWRYEVTLKRLESQLDSVLGANGAIYALRKEIYEPPPRHIVADDLVIPLRIRERGYRVVYEPSAVALEEMAPNLGKEFGRKMRIGAAAFQAIPATWGLLHPRHGLVAFFYWSHKILRWLVPFCLIAALVSSLLLVREPLYLGLVLAQAVLYLSAGLGHWLHKRQRRLRWLAIPYYFSYMNLALLVGFFRFLSGRQKAAWESGRC